MANGKNRVDIQVGFSVDKSGLSEMQSLFQQIANKAADPANKMKTGLQEAAKTASTLDNILSKTFNTDLGSLNVTKFNQELSKSGLSLKDIKANLSQAGNQGVTAFNRLSQAILGTNQQIRQSNKALDQMFTTFKNTIRYGISSSIFNNMANSIQKAFDYSKQLDTSLNDIRIVTDKSAESMAKFAQQANEASKGMGASTLDYTNAALIYYQQGLSDSEVQARAETTIKAANVTGQRGEEVSEQLTAVWNGYKVSAEETELYVDKLAAVAATTAADLEELSVGMSKVASAANAMGVDFDDLNAQIATIVSVTRQAPESVGTALKTIYARMGDLSVEGGVDEFGVSLGKVSEQMQMMGIQILDQNGNLRDMTTIMTEVAKKWDTWTEAQRQAAAVAMAGKRQYNNLIALFDNWDMYNNALETSQEAMGTLQEQQDIYMESTAAKLKTLKAAWQGLYDDAIDEGEINAGIEALTNLVEVFDNFISSFGGGLKSVAGFGAILSSVFNRQIADNIANANQQMQVFRNNLELTETKSQMMSLNTLNAEGGTSKEIGAAANSEKQLAIAKEIYAVRAGLNQEQAKSLINLQKEVGTLTEEKVALETITQRQAEKTLGAQEVSEFMKAELSAAEDINSKYGDRVDKLNDILANEIKIEDILNGEARASLDINTAKTEILQLSKIMDISENENFETLINETTTLEDLYGIREQILEIIHRSTLGVEEELEKAEEQAAVADQVYKNKTKIYDIDIAIKNKEIEIKQALEQAQMNSNITQQVMTITSALGNMAMAWSSVNSLIDTWNNKDASFGDKILQSFMTLGMTIPLVVGNLNKLNEVLNINIVTENKATTIQGLKQLSLEAEMAAQEAKTLALQADTAEEYANIVAEEDSIVADKAAEAAEKANIIATEAHTVAETKKIAVSQAAKIAAEKSAFATIKEAIAIKAGTLVVDDNTRAYIMNKAIRLGWIAVIMAGVAAVALVIKSIEKWHETQKKEAEETLKSVKAKQEEIQANKELYDSYNKLYKQFQETHEASEDLYNTTLELADAYGIQSARVLALAGDYEELTRQIKEARKTELEEANKQATEGSEAASKHIAHDITSGRGYISGNQYKFSVGGGYGAQSDMMRETVSAIGLGDYIDSTGGFSYNIDYTDPEAVAEWMKQVDNMVSYMETAYTSAQLSHDAFYKQIKKDQEDGAEYYQELQTQLDALYSGKTELAFIDIDLDSIKNAQQLQQVIDNVKKDLSESIPEDKVDNFIKNYLKGIDSIADELDKINLAEKISEQTGEGLNEVLNQIQNFNASQLAFLSIHLNTALLSEDLNQWISDNQDYISLTGAQQSMNNYKGMLEGYNPDEGFSQDQLSNIYQDESMSEFMQASENELSMMDSAQQLDEITKAWIENTQYVVEHRKEIVDALETEEKELTKVSEAKENAAQKDRNTLQQLINNSENYGDKQQELFSIIKKLGADGADSYDELNGSQKALIDGFSKEVGIQKEVLSQYGKTISEADNYAISLSDIRKRIQDVSDAELNYNEIMNQIATNIAEHNSIIDSIQDAYKTLVGIVDSYNETGAFTIDTVQQLMTMSDQYVAQLQFEGNQLSLNEAGFQALTLAKLDDLAADAELQYQLEMTELALIAVNNQNDAAAQKEALHAKQLAVLGQVASETAQQLWDLAASMSAIDAYGSEDLKKAADEKTKAYENKKKALENARANVGKGGASMRSAMGAPSKSSGGGGGSSKDKQKQEKELKQLDEELDRYWEINKALDAIDRTLKKIDKEQEHLNGPELIASLEEENKVLEQQKERYEQLYEAQQAEAAELRGQLSGMGVAFDESSGAILNYAEAVAAALATYNAAVAAFNAGPQDEAAQKSLEAAERAYENFKKLMERYDTLYYTEMQNTQEKMEDIWRQQMENKLKAWKTKVELELDKNKLEQQWDEFLLKAKKDFKKVWDMKGNVADSQYQVRTAERAKDNVYKTIERQHEVQADMDRMQAGGESELGFQSIAEARDALKELDETMRENGDAVYEAYKNAWSNYLDGIDQVADQLEMVNREFERQNEILNFNKQIIELLYGEEAYELMDHYYEGQYRANINNIESLQTQKDMWEEQLKKVGMMDKKTGKLTIDYQNMTEDQKELYDKWRNAQTQIYDLTVETVKLLQDEYANEIKKILQPQVEATKAQREEWERIKKSSEGYYDSIESTYQIQKLSNKYSQSIVDAKSIKAKEKLKKLQEEEIERLQKLKEENKELSEYEIQYADAKYEAALKEIALEDAQNTKTSMKLTRDEQGNWSYQYIAEEDDIIAKKQELLDSYNQLYQLASDAQEKGIETIITLTEEFNEKLEEIAIEYRDNDEKRKEEEQKLYEEYYGEDGYITKVARQNAEVKNDLATAGAALVLANYNNDKDAYKSMTEDEITLAKQLSKENISSYSDIEKQVLDSNTEISKSSKKVMSETKEAWNSAAQKMMDQWNKDGGASIRARTLETYNKIENANMDYQVKLDELEEAADVNFGEEGIKGDIDAAAQATDDLTSETERLCDEGSDYIDQLRDYVKELEDAWHDVCDAISDAIDLLREYLSMVGDVERAQATSAGIADYSAPEPATVIPTTTSSGTESNKNGGSSTNNNDSTGWTGGSIQLGYRGTGGYSLDLKDITTGKTVYQASSLDKDKAMKEIEDYAKKNNYFIRTDGKKDGYATGGYTGEWQNGSDINNGRLAMLHQKELVLNADDTKNFLAGVNTIRDLTASNGSIEAAVLRAAANMASSLGNVSPGTVYSGGTTNNSESSNVFNITAEFPNANSVDEIREAILSLPNLASQYIHSNLK